MVQSSRFGTIVCALLGLALVTGCGGAAPNNLASSGATTTSANGSSSATTTPSTPTPTPSPTPTPTPSPTPTPIVTTTSLTAETSTNTSVATSYPQAAGNEAPSNVSKVDTRSLLYSGATTKIYAHFMAWFGNPNHMGIGYTSSDPNQVQRQVSDALSRGISGFIEDWYGPNHSNDLMSNDTAFVLKTESESRNGAFEFAMMADGGALDSSCTPPPGQTQAASCLTDQMITLLTYAYNKFEISPAYMKIGGRPAVFFFDPDRFGTLDWQRIASSIPGNPVLIFQNSGGFTHAQSSGSISWVMINKGVPDDWSQSYLDNFYSAAVAHPQGHAFAATYKGFNDTLASWTAQRIVNQNCGQTWLNTFSEIGKFYSANSQLESLQLVTWNDYEEATEIETGIDNCINVSASVSGTELSWSLSGPGQENTIDHYTPYISVDGENLMALSDLPTGTHTLDLSTYHFAAGNYKVYVKAVGKPSIKNQMSGAATFVSSGS